MEHPYTADDIQTLSMVDAIRRRPHLYFEACFREETLDALPFEALCHAFDEHHDGVCKSITIDVGNDSFTVSYDAGISLENMPHKDISVAESIMTEIFACRNAKKHLEVGEAYCHLGLATVNFATERSELITMCKGQKGHFVFEKGVIISREISMTEASMESTAIYMKPDRALFENLSLTQDGIEKKAKQIKAALSDLEIIVQSEMS